MGWANACHPICHAGNPLKIPIQTSDAPVNEKVDLVVRAKETPEKPPKSVP
jgi:cobalamin biosynthesis protein CobT